MHLPAATISVGAQEFRAWSLMGLFLAAADDAATDNPKIPQQEFAKL